jgi:hypothetical protein
MRSGAHTDGVGLYATDPYPPAWRQPSAQPVARGPIDEAMARAAAVLVVPDHD